MEKPRLFLGLKRRKTQFQRRRIILVPFAGVGDQVLFTCSMLFFIALVHFFPEVCDLEELQQISGRLELRSYHLNALVRSLLYHANLCVTFFGAMASVDLFCPCNFHLQWCILTPGRTVHGNTLV